MNLAPCMRREAALHGWLEWLLAYRWRGSCGKGGMARKRSSLKCYGVEFSARGRSLLDVRGVLVVRVKHWSRARRAAELRLKRSGLEVIALFRASWLAAVPASKPRRQRLKTAGRRLRNCSPLAARQ